MAALFTAHREDGKAEWRVLAEHVATLDYGTELTFAQLFELLDTSDRSRVYRVVREANRQLVKPKSPVRRYLGSVRGIGYKVLLPTDYTPAALAKRDSAHNRINDGLALLQSAPLDELPPGARRWAQQVTLHMADMRFRLMSMEDRQTYADERIARLERMAGLREPVTVPAEVDYGEPVTVTAEAGSGV